MVDNSELNALHRKLAALERRIHKLENNYQELDTVVDPQGWIGEAFERMEQDIDEVRQEVRQNGQKLDLILQRLTGMQS